MAAKVKVGLFMIGGNSSSIVGRITRSAQGNAWEYGNTDSRLGNQAASDHWFSRNRRFPCGPRTNSASGDLKSARGSGYSTADRKATRR